MMRERRDAVRIQWLLSPQVKKVPTIEEIAGFKDPEEKYLEKPKQRTFESKEEKEKEIGSIMADFGIGG